jgi:general secretion pathway protein G
MRTRPRPTRSTRRRAGFTLMEVLLVLAILVILGSLAAVAFQSAMGDSDKRAAKAQIGLFEGPLKFYYLHMKSYPSAASGLEALRTPPGDLPNPAKWQGPYLDKAVPLDPWDRPYRYAYPGTRNPDSFDIWSMGPDGQDGTDDDIGNWQ